jgi:hypothetical protein
MRSRDSKSLIVTVSFPEGRCGTVQVLKACAFDENHIRFGFVLRNEYSAWNFYREKSRVIRSIFVPQERISAFWVPRELIVPRLILRNKQIPAFRSLFFTRNCFSFVLLRGFVTSW